jgi:hypothetical protein
MQAKELLHILKTQNKRMFIAWLITFIAFIGLLGYTIWLLNDISVIDTTTQEVEDVDTINGNVINNGGNYGEN